ncbi:MAG: hypothetical protein U0794_10215 [Isosphaeraceae bacterium]
MTTRLPTAAEINVFDSLDERSALRHFLGKDLDQAYELLRENFLYYQEDLFWMGPIALRFYVPAAIRYLLSDEADHDAGAVAAFCGILEFRLEHEPAALQPIAPLLRGAIDQVLNRLERYGADLAMYGDLAGRYRDVLERLQV